MCRRCRRNKKGKVWCVRMCVRVFACVRERREKRGRKTGEFLFSA